MPFYSVVAAMVLVLLLWLCEESYSMFVSMNQGSFKFSVLFTHMKLEFELLVFQIFKELVRSIENSHDKMQNLLHVV